jgi:hypothetical protein
MEFKDEAALRQWLAETTTPDMGEVFDGLVDLIVDLRERVAALEANLKSMPLQP